MDDLYIKRTFNSPEIEFLADTGELSMEGRSIPEDPGEFYERLIDWVNDYFLKPAQKTLLSIKLEYINSGSSKYMLELLRIMKANHENGKQVHIKWYFEEGDESIQELGQHYEQTIRLPFEHIEYE
ncbi:MAG: DUF1987 domain-containing protein [Bacteroidales bacterium]|nr:DUF1987 domain-containing protein [Bacteroidales bacterium]MBN2697748.1 DUF1987 domain-containing protein [Bacteroidales bacterium]